MPIQINGIQGTISGLTSAAVGGGTTTTSAVNITLTPTSAQAQEASFTATDKGFVLPNATTVTNLGGPIFALSNKGYNKANIFSSDGGRIGAVNQGQTVYVGLSNNSNASAGWFSDIGGSLDTKVFTPSSITLAVGLFSTPEPGFFPNNFSTTSTITYDVVALNSTSFILVYIGTNQDIYGVVGQISGTTISYGTPQLLVVGTISAIKLCALSATTGFIIASPAGNTTVWGFSVSGTTITITAGANINFNAALGDIVALDATRAVIVYNNRDFGQAGQRVVTYNGASAPTFGTEARSISVANSTTPYFCVCKIDTDKCVVFGENGDGINNATYAQVVSVSGTTVTLGSTRTLNSTTRMINRQALALSTSIAYCTNGTTVSISGTTATILNQGPQYNLAVGSKVLAYLGSNIAGMVEGNINTSQDIYFPTPSGVTQLVNFSNSVPEIYGKNHSAISTVTGKAVPIDSTTYLAFGSSAYSSTTLEAVVVKTNL